MRVNMKSHARVKLETVDAGSAFVAAGHRQKLMQVLDLTVTDEFTHQPVLRKDMVYVCSVETGVVEALPKNLEVELREVEVSEI